MKSDHLTDMGMDETFADVQARLALAERHPLRPTDPQHDAHARLWLSKGIEEVTEAAFIARRDNTERIGELDR